MTERRYVVFLIASVVIVTLVTALAVRFGPAPGIAAALVLAAAAFVIVFALYGFTVSLFARLNDATSRIAQGDLSGGLEPVPGPGSFGRVAVNVAKVCKGMVKHLGAIVRNMGVLEKDAEQIKRGVEQVVQGGRVQAGNIKEIVARVESYAGRNREIGQWSQQSQALAVETGDLAVKGEKKIDGVRQMIEKIEAQVQSIESAAGNIFETAAQVADISRQTNFLALSAAIEAARAGEHGRGFQTVAEQVSRLAEGTGESTTEIAAIMEGVNQGVDDTKTAVREGMEKLLRFEASFADIRTKAAMAVAMVQAVGARLNEQGQMTTAVVENVRSIARVAEETAAAAESVGSLTGELTGVVGRFRAVADTYRL